jgi:hypothetical protein
MKIEIESNYGADIDGNRGIEEKFYELEESDIQQLRKDFTEAYWDSYPYIPIEEYMFYSIDVEDTINVITTDIFTEEISDMCSKCENDSSHMHIQTGTTLCEKCLDELLDDRVE